MKKTTGFTLIELLAVIVILAIIALITIPTILSVIAKATQGSYESSALGYVDAVEKQMAVNEVESNSILDGTYDKDELTLLYKGKEPDEASVTISNSQVEVAFFKYNDYYVCYYNGEVTSSTTKSELTDCIKYENGTAIYFNPETNEVCSESDYQVNLTNNGLTLPTTLKTGCMKWYTFNDEYGTDTANMILDHNTTALVTWNSNNKNTSMKEVAVQLAEDTSTWDSSLNARLITADEIATITGNTSIDEETLTSSSWFYLDGAIGSDSTWQTRIANSTNKSNYAWLYDYTDGCTSYGCNIEDNNKYVYSETITSYVDGYWTSTPVAGTFGGAWRVSFFGALFTGNVSFDYLGVRPVITISKSIISES
jgi:prepilin-type N-terminal cleavage/methylation domain-containing protein